MPPIGQGNLRQSSGMASNDSVPHSERFTAAVAVVVVVVSVEVLAMVVEEAEGEMVVQELILA